MAVLLALLGIVYNPLVLAVAAVFGLVTYLLWMHGTGRLAARLYERVQRQAEHNVGRERAGRRTARGGFGAGPREDWRPPGGRGRRRRTRKQRAGQRRTGSRRSSDDGTGDGGPTVAEAARRLDVAPDADQQTIKQAYRERVKSAHPDADGGSEEAFKRVRAAYERLREQ